ncbi:hypothetical protein [Devosia sp.]|nr:hypothetical protein [Devosia sp.]
MRWIRSHIALVRLALARWHGECRERHMAAVAVYLEGLQHEE